MCLNSIDASPEKSSQGDKRTKPLLFHWENVYDFFVLLRNFPSSRVFYFFVVIIVQQACKSGEIDVTLLFTMKAPLSWNQSTYGYFLATDYACLGLATSALLPFFIKVFGTGDVSLAIIGVAFKIVRVVILAVSSATWMVFVSAVCGCPSALIISCLKSLVSKSFHEKDLGKIFALLSGCETFSNLVGNVVFNQVYVSTLSFFAGFIFCLDSFIFFFLLLGLIYVGCTEAADGQEKPLRPGQLDDYGAVKEIPKIVLD